MAIITISRGAFSKGEDLAECVAAKLGYRLVSREVLVHAANQYGTPLNKLEHALVDKPSLLERMGVERAHYLAYIQAALCNEAREDGMVYHGHAGHLLLKGVPHVLRVRVTADMDFRVRVAMEREGLTRKKAEEAIRHTDAERAKWTQFLYRVDWLDPTLYDLVISLHHITMDSACEAVCLASRLPAYQYTQEAGKIMEDLVLSAAVRARIATDSKGSDKDISVDAEDGVVTLNGTVSSIESADIIKQSAARTPGVKDLRSQLKIRTHW